MKNRTDGLEKEQSQELSAEKNRSPIESLSSIRVSPAMPGERYTRILTAEIKCLSQKISIHPEEIEAWLSQFHNMPEDVVLALIRTAQKYSLNPLHREILAHKYPEGWNISLSIDAWIKLINNQQAFRGISFAESPCKVGELPFWGECTISRSDRIWPITVREYLSEVSQDHEIWQKMPRRMLRYKALQQCARIAFGICIPDFLKIESLKGIKQPIPENTKNEHQNGKGEPKYAEMLNSLDKQTQTMKLRHILGQ
ncbi:recombinase RecT [Polynucleobacter sp. MWH-UH19D]|uniref:recombinase RecT n=1 Tax=Polynucleobacter sp. MWH-UH19D TaxID=1855610 RepID=UPI0033651AFA